MQSGKFLGRWIFIPSRYPGSTTPRLPRGGRVGRVLAAVDAVTACSA